MKAKEYVGIIPPMLSSFKKDGEVYEKGIRSIVRFLLPHVNGLYPVGTYGCGPFMTVDERKRVLEIILEEVGGRVPVVAHVGAASTHVAVDLARHARENGAAGVGAISPYYSPGLPEDSLFDYFAGILSAVNDENFPFFVYNNAHYSQNSVSPRLLRRLAQEGLRGCKDSSFDLVNYYQYQDAVQDYRDFNIIIGTEAIFLGAFDAGATGTVCGIGNIFPELLAKLYTAYQTGDRKEAFELQRLIIRVRAVTKLGPTVPIMHEILKMRGVDAGYSRSPLIPIEEALADKVRDELEKLAVLE